MFGPRALRTLARAPRTPIAQRFISSTPIARAGAGKKLPPPPRDENGKNLLFIGAAIALVVTSGMQAVHVRATHTSAPPDKPEEVEEQEEEQPEVQAEDAQPVVQAAEAIKTRAAASPEGLNDDLASLIEQAERALQAKPADQADAQSALAAEAASQGAFNEETGEINWDCPCLGGMATGPCGEDFKAAFSCFVYSEQEPKGIDCVEKFKAMQDCFREHPDIYGEEIDDDEEPAKDAEEKK